MIEALGKLFFVEIKKIATEESPQLEKIESLYYLLQKIVIEVTQQERIHFTTLFSRIAYLSHKHQFSNTLQYQTYRFRKMSAKKTFKNDDEIQTYYWLGLKIVSETVAQMFDLDLPEDLREKIPTNDFFPTQPVEIQERLPKIRVTALEDDRESEWLICRSEEQPDKILRVKYNDRRNENYNLTIKAIRSVFGFPVTLNLLEVNVDANGVLYPRVLVVEPDYLMDVTSISECFKEDNHTEPLQYLLNRFLPKAVSTSILLGNIANFFLDELIVNPEQDFTSVFAKTFRLSPFQFALLEDEAVKEIVHASRIHFHNLQRIIMEQFETEDLHRKYCFLEPSFYSETYGLQGRLDLLQLHPEDVKKNAIVELKSGKPFRPNAHGISHSHFTQTLLYDLMVKSAFGDDAEPQNFILYSGIQDNHLRYAPAVRSQQYEALQLRNQLVAIEQSLINLNKNDTTSVPFDKLRAANFTKGGFLQRDIEVFEKIYTSLDALEKKYFHAFASMVAKEHQLSKTGIQGVENANGVASLWLNELAEKEENFTIFSFLTIKDNQSLMDDPIIIFAKTERTNPLANFRIGDIATLYPVVSEDANGDMLRNQVFKGTIIGISPETVTFRLRARQFNQRIFKDFDAWNIEHDLMDSSYTNMYRGLFEFFVHKKEKRNLLLTTKSPSKEAQYVVNEQAIKKTLTSEQQRILKKMIATKDYFLLWGPPGTGKTSMMLRHLTEYLVEHSDENILLLAFTNRAVDEICEAIEANGAHYKDLYVRIGSRYATAEQYHSNLLDKKIEQVKTRQELRDTIANGRIFVATVAAMNSKPELLKLKNFDTIIIDEASQILEPQIVGLLPHFKRFILIGDHRQLPAIVLQGENETAIADEALRAIGLDNLRNSLFERMYHRCQANQWDWAYDQLSHQGRMHEEIVAFPSKHFYGDNLHILPQGFQEKQTATLSFMATDKKSNLLQQLATSRKIFFPTKQDTQVKNSKVNRFEAEKVGEIVEAIEAMYRQNGLDFYKSTVGIITPYRAQIAQIQQILQAKNLPLDKITVDTVERYQGGARDIIILSLCTNHAAQVKSLVSLSTDGIDRKLNVALTRAREQLIVLGNETLLREVGNYATLLDWLKSDG